MKDFESKDVLRVLVPDVNGLFPDQEGCDDIYKMQLLPTDALTTENVQNN